MSSPTYVTQNEYLLDDDTTLMSTTDVHSYLTHANDTFVQVSGYQLNELMGQPHNLVRHPDMPKAAFADMWYTLQQGEPWSGIVKNRRKNGTPRLPAISPRHCPERPCRRTHLLQDLPQCGSW